MLHPTQQRLHAGHPTTVAIAATPIAALASAGHNWPVAAVGAAILAMLVTLDAWLFLRALGAADRHQLRLLDRGVPVADVLRLTAVAQPTRLAVLQSRTPLPLDLHGKAQVSECSADTVSALRQRTSRNGS